MFPHQYRRWCDIIEVRRNKKLLSPHASTTIIKRMMNPVTSQHWALQRCTPVKH